MADRLKESDLAKHFIKYLEDLGYDVYQEVPAGHVVDIVGKLNNMSTAVEVKTSLNFNVIEQAFFNQKYFQYSYIAVPAKKMDFSLRICQDYGIGVLFCTKWGKVFEAVPAALKAPIKNVKLEQYMKMSVAGSQHERMTAFGFTIHQINEQLKKENGQLLNDILKNTKHHWKNDAIARQCLTKYCKKGVVKSFKIDDGRLYLTEQS